MCVCGASGGVFMTLCVCLLREPVFLLPGLHRRPEPSPPKEARVCVLLCVRASLAQERKMAASQTRRCLRHSLALLVWRRSAAISTNAAPQCGQAMVT